MVSMIWRRKPKAISVMMMILVVAVTISVLMILTAMRLIATITMKMVEQNLVGKPVTTPILIIDLPDLIIVKFYAGHAPASLFLDLQVPSRPGMVIILFVFELASEEMSFG